MNKIAIGMFFLASCVWQGCVNQQSGMLTHVRSPKNGSTATNTEIVALVKLFLSQEETIQKRQDAFRKLWMDHVPGSVRLLDLSSKWQLPEGALDELGIFIPRPLTGTIPTWWRPDIPSMCLVFPKASSRSEPMVFVFIRLSKQISPSEFGAILIKPDNIDSNDIRVLQVTMIPEK